MTSLSRRLLLLLALAAFAVVAATARHGHSGHGHHRKRHSGVDGTDPPDLSPTKTTDSSHVQQVAKLQTNAERFAAGLPPLRPRSLVTPTKIRRSRASASPSPSLSLSAPLAAVLSARRSVDMGALRTGLVQVVEARPDGNYTTLGWVSRAFTSDGMYVVARDDNHALEVEFDVRLTGGGTRRLANVGVLNPQDDDSPFFGLITSPMNLDPVEQLGGGNQNRACLGMTPGTHSWSSQGPLLEHNHPRSYDHHALEATESSIWRFATSAQPGIWMMNPVWINADGRRPEDGTALVLSKKDGTLCVVGSEGVEGSVTVELRLVLDS